MDLNEMGRKQNQNAKNSRKEKRKETKSWQKNN